MRDDQSITLRPPAGTSSAAGRLYSASVWHIPPESAGFSSLSCSPGENVPGVAKNWNRTSSRGIAFCPISPVRGPDLQDVALDRARLEVVRVDVQMVARRDRKRRLGIRDRVDQVDRLPVASSRWR